MKKKLFLKTKKEKGSIAHQKYVKKEKPNYIIVIWL